MKASDFLALASLRRDKVEVDGKTIHVREMSVADRASFLDAIDKSPTTASASLVRICATEEDGTPMFTEADAVALAAASPRVIEKVATAVLKLSGMESDPPKD